MGTFRASRQLRGAIGSSDVAKEASLRSVALRDQLQAKWRDEVQRLGPAGREIWLKSTEAIVLFGARRCRDMLRGIAKQRAVNAAAVVSVPWLDAWEDRAELPPSASVNHQCDRQYSAKMILSAGSTAIGDGPFTRRFTPPQAVGEEDLVDLLSPFEAEFHPHPGSPSAAVINRIAERLAQPQDGLW